MQMNMNMNMDRIMTFELFVVLHNKSEPFFFDETIFKENLLKVNYVSPKGEGFSPLNGK